MPPQLPLPVLPRRMRLLGVMTTLALLLLTTFLGLTHAIPQQSPITQVTLLAAGTSAHLEFLQQLVLAYQLVSPNVTLTFDFAPSATIQPYVLTGRYDFGVFVSSAVLTAATMTAYPDIRQLPLFTAAIVPVYNIPSLPPGSPPIQFTQQTLARIVRGNITFWNDPALVELNPFLARINQGIVYTNGAKWTAMFVDVLMQYVCQADSLVAKTVGCTSATYDPTRVPYFRFIAQTKVAEVASFMQQHPNAFGFVPPALAAARSLAAGTIYLPQWSRAVTATTVSIDLALYERGLQIDPVTNLPDLTLATGANAWPLSVVQVLQFGATYTRLDCQTRVEMARFLYWLYHSPIAASLAEQSELNIFPAMVQEAYGIDTILNNDIKCGSVAALPASSLAQGQIRGTSQLSVLMNLLLIFYQQIDTTTMFSFTTSTWSASQNSLFAVQSDAVIDASRDLPLVNGYTRFPLFIGGLQLMYQLPYNVVVYPGVLPLVIDVDTMTALFLGRITSWLDRRIIQFNPALASAIAATGMNPQLGIVVCCTDSTATRAATDILIASMRRSVLVNTSPFVSDDPLTDFDWSLIFNPTALAAGTIPNYRHVANEAAMPSTIFSNTGFIGYQVRASASLAPLTPIEQAFQILPWKGISDQASIDTDGSLYPNARQAGITATAANMLNCIRGSLDSSGSGEMISSQTSVLDFTLGRLNMAPPPYQTVDTTPRAVPSNCYPLVTVLNVLIPSSYSGGACARGKATLHLFRWLVTGEISVPATAAGLGVTTDLPEIESAFLNRLTRITCDGESMLQVQSTTWTMGATVHSVGLLFTILPLIICVATAILLYRLRDRSVFRSSSVLFLGLTLAGLVMMLIGALLWTLQDITDSVCLGFTVTTQIGFTLTFAPLFIKTWRIYYIFERRQLKVVKISNTKLSLVVLLALAFDIAVLVAWNTQAPIRVSISEVTQAARSAGGLGHIEAYGHCAPTSDAIVYFWLLMGSKMLALVFGAVIGFATRNVHATFNESSSVARSIWNVVLSCVILIALILLLDVHGDTLIALVLILIVWITVATWILQFGEKIVKLDEFKAMIRYFAPTAMMTEATGVIMVAPEAGGSHVRTATHESLLLLSHGSGELGPHEHGAFTFASFITMGVVTLARYIGECERQMAAVKKAFLRAGGAKAFFRSLRYLDEVHPAGDHEGTLTEHSLLASPSHAPAGASAPEPSYSRHHSRGQGSIVAFEDQEDHRSRPASAIKPRKPTTQPSR